MLTANTVSCISLDLCHEIMEGRGRYANAVCAGLNFQQSNPERNARFSDEIVPVLRVSIALGEEVFCERYDDGSRGGVGTTREAAAGSPRACAAYYLSRLLLDRLGRPRINSLDADHQSV